MLRFKSTTLSDVDSIVNLMQAFYDIDNYPFDMDKSKKLVIAFLENENLGSAWLIYVENEIVGYVILTYIFSFEYQGRIAFLDELFLLEKVRGKGIGTKTIDFVKEEALKLKLKVIYLEVEKHNKNAQKLYIASDFVFQNRKLMKYIV